MTSKFAGYAGRMHAELVAAESRLMGARQNFKAAVADALVSTNGIFSETVFVPRRLMTERLAEMEAANSVALKAALTKTAKAEMDDDSDDHRDKGDDDQWGEPDENGKRRRKGKRAAPVEDQPAERDPSEPGAPDAPTEASYQAHIRATAAAIIAAGAKRRGEI